MLGCSNVIGVDIDDEALEAAYENLERNNISDKQVRASGVFVQFPSRYP